VALTKRDMDLIRTLLLRIESDPLFDGHCQVQPNEPADLRITDHSYAEVAYHLNLLIDEGFVKGSHTMQMPFISQLTWNGHEFLADVSDPDVWRKTKERAKTITNVGLGFLWEIAKAKIKAKLGLP
jgi:hypothetical protein